MAKKRVINIELVIDEKGTVQATKNLGDLNREVEVTKNAQNKLKRNLEGVSKRANTQGKDFSRLSQGMGGLVKAYATVAANVFALSSVFRVLQASADFDSMTKSAENLSAVTGRDFTALSARLREASGGALNLAQSLEVANKAAATGLDNARIEQLTVLATKAAQTFGGTTTDSITRFTDAILRGRTELVAKTGVVIRMDTALQAYAQSIGKSTKNLSDFERKQAVANAIIAEGNRTLGDVVIDPNPYETLVRAFQDLGYEGVQLIRAVFDPLAAVVRDTKEIIVLVAAVLVKSLITKAIPALESFGDAYEIAAEKARNNLASAQEANTRFVETIRAQGEKLIQIEKRNFDTRLKNQLKFLSDSKSATKLAENVRSDQVTLDVEGPDVKNLQRQLTQGLKGNFVGVDSEIKNLIESNRDAAVRALEEVNTAIDQHKAKVKSLEREVKVATERASNGFRGYGRTINIALAEAKVAATSTTNSVNQAMNQQTFALSKVIIGWKTYTAEVAAAGVQNNLTASAIAKTSAVVAGGATLIAKTATILVGIFFKLFLAVTIVRTVFNLLRKTFFDTSDEAKALQETIENNARSIESLEKSTRNFTGVLARSVDSEPFDALSSKVNFLANSFQELKTITEEATGAFGIEVLKYADRLEEAEKRLTEVNQRIRNEARTPLEGFRMRIERFQATSSVRVDQRSISESAKQMAAQTTQAINLALRQADSAGLGDRLKKDIIDNLRSTELGSALVEGLAEGADISPILMQLKKDAEKGIINIPLIGSFNLDKLDATQLRSLEELFESLGRASQATVTNIETLGRGLQDINASAAQFANALENVNMGGIQDRQLFDAFTTLSRGLTDAGDALGNLGVEKTIELLNGLPAVIKNAFDIPLDAEGIAAFVDLIPADELNAKLARIIFRVEESLEVMKDSARRIGIKEEILKQFDFSRQLNDINIRNARVINNQLRITTENNVLQQQRLATERAIVLQRIEQLRILASTLEGDKVALALNQQQIATLQGQYRLLQSQESSLRSGVELAQELINIRKQETDFQSSLNSLQLQAREAAVEGVDAILLTVQYQRQVNALKANELDIQAQQARAEIAQLEALGQQTVESRRQLELARARLALTQAQAITLARNTSETALSISSERAILEIAKERLDLEESYANFRKESAINSFEVARAEADSLRLAKEKLKNEQASASLRAKELIEQRSVEGVNQALLEQRIQNEQRRVFILEQQTRELQKQVDLQDALALDRMPQGGIVQFLSGDPQAIKAAAVIFGNEIEKALKTIEGPLETFAKGFVTTVNSVSETLARGVVEGGKILRNTVEALKAGIRQVLIDQLANKLREVFFNMVLGQQTSEQQQRAAQEAQVKTQEVLTTENQQAQKYRETQEKNSIQALAYLRAIAECTCGSEAMKDILEKNDKLKDAVGRVEKATSGSGKGIETVIGTTTELVIDEQRRSTSAVVNSVVSSANSIINFMARQAKHNAIMGALRSLVSFGMSFGGGAGAGDVVANANGGILKGLQPFATGGVVTRPTAALIGEGKNYEAVVPLPNNKEIPVQFVGDRQDRGSQEIKIEQNFDFRGADAATVNQLRAEAKAIEERTFARVFSEINRGGSYAKISGRR